VRSKETIKHEDIDYCIELESFSVEESIDYTSKVLGKKIFQPVIKEILNYSQLNKVVSIFDESKTLSARVLKSI